jgi:hypothetical protein
MSKFQPVKFVDVDDMLASLPPVERTITDLLREIIFSTLPHVTERLAYNVPFYYGNSRICFIWPGSVPWGKTKEGVEFGFTKGYLLNDEWNYLERGNRKEVYIKTFLKPDQVRADILKMLLLEAAQVDLSHKI